MLTFQSMNAPIEGIFVTVSVLLLTGMVTCRPRRRFCENYPFAPRCLGVAAKRDVSHSYHIETDIDDTYQKLKSLLDKYNKDDTPDYWDNKPDETNTDQYVPAYKVLSHLMRRRRNLDLSDTKVIDPDIWVDYDE
ncbi:uncharacterized protein LOC127704864 isoform X1 [Mytilus californianus]|uniref:uncharacterized protein LOC127704864 isoform X1 n=2 Tax=Mytilus californianus TaxID=6549 RepID=UPI0022452A81|nr:uncharacterized protein LOC127704864 isoform X1 [Mytilus californianus]